MPTGHLSTPLTNYEKWLIGRLYKENIQLIRFFGHRCLKKYSYINEQDIYSCIDIAFVKAARVWKPERGTLSNLLWHYINGEIRHFIRSNDHWGFAVPRHVRELGSRARMLIAQRKVPISVLHGVLGCPKEELQEALRATLSIVYSADSVNGRAERGGSALDLYEGDEEDEPASIG